MIDIFITFYQRPEMAELTIESINNARKPKEYRITGFFEYGFDPELEPIFDSLTGVVKQKVFRSTKYGVDWNFPRAWIETAEQTSGDYVIQLADDTYVSKDFFEFIDYCMNNYSDIEYATGFGCFLDGKEDNQVAINCLPLWWADFGTAMRTKFVLNTYQNYFPKDYQSNPRSYGKKFFPDKNVTGIDWYTNAIMHGNGIKGARPCLGRVTHFGITGMNFKLTNACNQRWNNIDAVAKTKILRQIIETGVYDIQSSGSEIKLSPRIVREYQWTDLERIEQV